MLIAAQIATAVVALIHVYIVVLEMLLFKARGPKVFGVSPDAVEILAPAMSNQGLYNGFLVAALVIGFVHADPNVAMAFTLFGLACVIVAGLWGAITVNRRILFVQALPAVIALVLVVLASRA
jgi:putative membrane protein